MEFILSNYVGRKVISEPFSSMTFAEMLEKSGATNFDPDEGVKYGSRVHLFKGGKEEEHRMFSIKVSGKVKTIDSIKSRAGFGDLIKNNVIYFGTATVDREGKAYDKPRHWATFGPKATNGEHVSFSLADVQALLLETAGAA